MATKRKQPIEAPPIPTAAPSDVCTPIHGAPYTLRIACRALERLVTGAKAILERRGSDGGWDALAAVGLASQRRLRSGPEATGFVFRALLRGAHDDARIALDRAAAWAIGEAEAGAAGKRPTDRGDSLDWCAERVATVLTGRARPADARANNATAIAYVWSAPAFLPAWVLDAPIPDALREPGVARLILPIDVRTPDAAPKRANAKRAGGVAKRGKRGPTVDAEPLAPTEAPTIEAEPIATIDAPTVEAEAPIA